MPAGQPEGRTGPDLSPLECPQYTINSCAGAYISGRGPTAPDVRLRSGCRASCLRGVRAPSAAEPAAVRNQDRTGVGSLPGRSRRIQTGAPAARETRQAGFPRRQSRCFGLTVPFKARSQGWLCMPGRRRRAWPPPLGRPSSVTLHHDPAAHTAVRCELETSLTAFLSSRKQRVTARTRTGPASGTSNRFASSRITTAR